MATKGPITFSLEGDREFLKFLDKFPKEMRKPSIATGALKAAAKPMVSAIRAGAPVKTGRLKKSIGTSVSKRKSGPIGQHVVAVGPITSKTKRGFPGIFIERGTKDRKTGRRGFLKLRKGRNTGRVQAKPFVEPAFNSTVGLVKTRLAGEIKKRLEKEAARVAAQVGSNR